MDMESWSFQMELSSKEISLIAVQKEKEKLDLRIKTFMKANGIRIWPTDLAFTFTLLEQYMKGTGRTTFSMVLEFNYGLTKANIKEIIDLVRNMDKENILGQMAVIIRVLGIVIRFQVPGNIYGWMEEHILVNGWITRCMERLTIFGKMVGNMMDTMPLIKSKALENIIGLTEDVFKVDGSTARGKE